MSCPTTFTPEMLAEAEAAYHKLMTGTAVVEFTDQNGDKVRFSSANQQKLYLYIQQMRAALNPACAPRCGNGPVGFLF